jgi:hypothetical protein
VLFYLFIIFFAFIVMDFFVSLLKICKIEKNKKEKGGGILLWQMEENT